MKWVWLPIIVGVAAILLVVAQADDHNIPPADGDADQSLMIGAGIHKNGGDGEAALLVYRHPLAHRLNMYLAIDRAEVEGHPSRTEMIAGLQIFPFVLPFYAIMGAGASKTSVNTDSIVSAGLGYQWALGRLWYIDTAAEVDMEFDGDTRWAGIIGVGVRF